MASTVGSTIDYKASYASLLDDYRARTSLSAAAWQRGRLVLPGGETRTVTTYSPYPTLIRKGQGAHLTDLDGNRYVDLVNNYTSLVHGSAYGPATEAAVAVLRGGAIFASPHESQLRLAEMLTNRIDTVELVRFTNSGTEAALLAERLAARATGRHKVLVFDGSYHGSAPELMQGHPQVVTAPYNDLDAVDRAMTNEIAAVFAEPFLGAGGVIPSAPGFLRGVQDLAHARGALFVLDEVQSLRNDVGGEQAKLGLTPDLTLLGKIIGGGLPIGAVGGERDLLLLTAPGTPDRLTHSGTFNGHPAAAAAGAITLAHLNAGAIDRLERAATTLAASITSSAAQAGMPIVVTRAGSILNVHFTDTPPTSAAHVRETNTDLLSALHLALLNQGVYTTPRGLINLSTALRAEDLAKVEEAYAKAFERIARISVKPGHPSGQWPVPAPRVAAERVSVTK
ncbi:aminotransferase class III-fold pyridoxal phosphate-dependent enzyme [Saccharopolyspora sp. NPDC050389]|uniref:aspartate aminotransferase family protein n=1 Tax=Saccharopolyspora sp. NPDC050389 TaxID=3155516 RepID=UPI0033FF549F